MWGKNAGLHFDLCYTDSSFPDFSQLLPHLSISPPVRTLTSKLPSLLRVQSVTCNKTNTLLHVILVAYILKYSLSLSDALSCTNSDTLSGTLPDFLPNIMFGILSDLFSDGILSGIPVWHSFTLAFYLISSGIYSDYLFGV